MKRITIIVLFLFLGMHFAFAQGRTVTGKITSVDEPAGIPGVTILVKGTTIGTVTNLDGGFTINVPAGKDVLVVSFVGYKQQEIAIGGQSVVNVVLEPDIYALDEVVVTGYAAHRKSEVTGSSVQLAGDQLADLPVVSVDQALQGRVAGVEVSSTSGTPGSVQDIRIRGRSSITAGNEPLYVIDGVPIVSDNTSATSSGSSFSTLAALNSNNIESITVLKDASATAAYGARGANGVIVITTKGGQAGKASINFSASYGFSNDAVEGPGVLTGADREMLFYEALINTYGANYNLVTQADAKAFYEAHPSSFGNDYVLWNAAGRPETDWADLITNKNAPMKDINVSASGGEEGYSYYTSIGYFGQEATVIGSDFERFSGTLNLDVNLSSSLKLSTKNSASHSYQDGLLETSAYFSSPRASKYFMPSTDQAYNEDGSINYQTTSLPNPLWIAQEDIDDSKFTRILTNNTLTWNTPIKNLTYTTRMNIDYHVYNYKRYRNPLRGDGDGETKGYGWQANQNRANYVFQNMFSYDLELNVDHKFNFKVIQEYQKNNLYYLEADADNFTDVGLTNLNSAGNPTTANSWFTDWSIASYTALVHYAFDDAKYVADLSFRREGSSRFAPDNRWGNFGAVGAAWNLDRESFIQNFKPIDILKLRASYGLSGNANIGLNQYQSLLNYDSDYAGEGASYPGTFGNNNLSWETNYTLDIGVDFGLFNNRVSGSLGYYRRETKDMLLDVNLSLTTGFTSQTRNIGRMENKGFELELNVDILRSKDMNLSIGGNLATNKNEVLELAKDLNGEEINITSTTKRVETGHPVYGWYMPTWAGVDPATGSEMWYVDPTVNDETTTNFNNAAQVWQGGSALPTMTAGINLHFDYKGAFIDVFGYYAGGHKIYEEWHRYTNGTDVYPVLYYQGVDALLDRWQQPGDVTRFGKFEYTGRPWQRHSKFLYEGDYFRLKDVVVGYDFDNNFLDGIGLGGLRVFVRGTNLFTWVKDENLKYDPEVGPNGTTGMATPPIKSIIFGINAKF